MQPAAHLTKATARMMTEKSALTDDVHFALVNGSVEMILDLKELTFNQRL